MDDRIELAWSAGFFDGEGSCFVHRLASGHKYLALMVSQSGDQVALTRFAAAVGAGYVVPVKGNGLSKKQRYRWQLWRVEEIDQVLEKLWPYLSQPTRDRIDACRLDVATGNHPGNGTRRGDPRYSTERRPGRNLAAS